MSNIRFGTFLVALLVFVFGLCAGGCGSGDSASASKSPAVKVVQTGPGRYVICGEDMDNVRGVNLQVLYDPEMLSAPQVNRKDVTAGMVFKYKADKPGEVLIVVVSPNETFKKSIDLAEIDFAIAPNGFAGLTVTPQFSMIR